MKCRKKPIMVDGYQYGIEHEPFWYRKAFSEGKIFEVKGESGCYVDTPYGRKHIKFADYIIIDENENFYVYTPDIFEKTYDVIEE